ncbi:MAG: hypothetical protein H8E25_10515 [Planctomycetes bacterium]|nr:hypothetical protein [Planctomycetota bacterium]
MQNYLQQAAAQDCMQTLHDVLPQIISSRLLHARMVNTLSRMEYVGTRKMLKARNSARVDNDGLMHIIEEASHALRLKRAAIKLNGGSEDGIATYSDEHTLAGNAAENYLQQVDRACEQIVADSGLCFEDQSEANYILSSVAIEVRADCFYPVYEQCLVAAGAPFSVASILKDEVKHLKEMSEKAALLFGDNWRQVFDKAFAAESTFFIDWAKNIKQAACLTPQPQS